MGDRAVLRHRDAEFALVGGLMADPAALRLHGEAVEADWFTDDSARVFFVALRRLLSAGSAPSREAVLAALPELGETGAAIGNRLYSELIERAVLPAQLPGVVGALRGAWARRQLAGLGERLAARARDYHADPFILADEAGMEASLVLGASGASALRPIAEGARAAVEQARGGGIKAGARTGLVALDDRLNGYMPGQLYVLAGRPGMGKSAFMCSSLRRTAAAGQGVVLFSLEMGGKEIAARMLADAVDSPRGPSFGAILRGRVGMEEHGLLAARLAEISALPLEVNDAPRLGFDEIATHCRRARDRHEAAGRQLGVIAIDHMGLVRPTDRYAGNRVMEAAEISGRARELAKELEACVLLLSQLSRDVEKRDDKRPVLSDLRWSGEIEQDAHVVAFLYREAYYREQDQAADPAALEACRRRIELLIRKNRNGPTADIPFFCSIAHSMIRDL